MAEKNSRAGSARDRLILAGIAEIRKSGVQNFSMRKTAEACGLSCAAPYKHFKDKQDFVLAIIRYVNKQWHATQQEVVAGLPEGDIRRLLLEICLAYIRFLVENPDFRSIIMLTEKSISAEQMREKAQLSQRAKQLIESYCRQLNAPDEVRATRVFIVRSLIYGASLMFDNGELEYSDENMEMVRRSIEQELVWP